MDENKDRQEDWTDEELEFAVYYDRFMRCLTERADNAELAERRGKLLARYQRVTGFDADSPIAKLFYTFTMGFDAGAELVDQLNKAVKAGGANPL